MLHCLGWQKIKQLIIVGPGILNSVMFLDLLSVFVGGGISEEVVFLFHFCQIMSH